MITLKDVSKTYTEGAPALSDINIQIDEGEFVFVVGDSGSGKSTLIKLLLKELSRLQGPFRSFNRRKSWNTQPTFLRNRGI